MLTDIHIQTHSQFHGTTDIESLCQPVNQPVSQPINNSAIHSFSQSTNQQFSHSFSQSATNQQFSHSLSQTNQQFSHSFSQPVSQSINQPPTNPASQPINQSPTQPVSQSTTQPVSQSVGHILYTYIQPSLSPVWISGDKIIYIAGVRHDDPQPQKSTTIYLPAIIHRISRIHLYFLNPLPAGFTYTGWNVHKANQIELRCLRWRSEGEKRQYLTISDNIDNITRRYVR